MSQIGQFEITKLINGQVDPEFHWSGGCWEDNENHVIIKNLLYGDNVDYIVKAVNEKTNEEIKIVKVQIVPAVF